MNVDYRSPDGGLCVAILRHNFGGDGARHLFNLRAGRQPKTYTKDDSFAVCDGKVCGGAPQHGWYHCRTCAYDLCLACATANVPKAPVVPASAAGPAATSAKADENAAAAVSTASSHDVVINIAAAPVDQAPGAPPARPVFPPGSKSLYHMPPPRRISFRPRHAMTS